MQQYFKDKFHRIKTHPSRWVRISVGVLLVLGGFLWFLPVLGLWMLPLGLILLSVDFPWAKRAAVNLKLAWRNLRGRFRGPRIRNKTPDPDP